MPATRGRIWQRVGSCQWMRSPGWPGRRSTAMSVLSRPSSRSPTTRYGDSAPVWSVPRTPTTSRKRPTPGRCVRFPSSVQTPRHEPGFSPSRATSASTSCGRRTGVAEEMQAPPCELAGGDRLPVMRASRSWSTTSSADSIRTGEAPSSSPRCSDFPTRRQPASADAQLARSDRVSPARGWTSFPRQQTPWNVPNDERTDCRTGASCPIRGPSSRRDPRLGARAARLVGERYPGCRQAGA